ncbi:MAG: NAD(P)/FAD-dependent oxidoreductase, partial [Pseudomonadota bacterium]
MTEKRPLMPATRRSVLKLTAASLAAGIVPTTARATEQVDTVVIGAGLAGLNAALILEEAGERVVVLEGRGRVGGRVLSFSDLPGNPEAGANSFFPGYARTMSLCERLGVGYQSYGQFRMRPSTILNIKDRYYDAHSWAEAEVNPLPADIKATLPYAAVPKLVAQHNPLADVTDWQRPEMRQLDGPTHEFLKQHGWSDEAIRLCHDTNVAYGKSSHDVSQLMWFFIDAWIKRQMTLGTSEYVIKGGNAQLPIAMASALSGPIHLGKRVVSVVSDRHSVEVRTHDGDRFGCGKVIVTTPLPPLRQIAFEPGLSSLKREALLTVGQMPITQLHLVPKKPFWEDDGMPPGIWTDGPLGQIAASYAQTDPGEVGSFIVWGRGFDAL